MAYATQQDIIDRYGEDALNVAADRDGDQEIDGAAVERALRDASAEIDSYIAARYTLPLPAVPAVLTPLCVDMALYRLSVGPALTEEHRKRYEDAVALLVRIAKGDVVLGTIQSDASAGQSLSGEAWSSSAPRDCTRQTMRGL